MNAITRILVMLLKRIMIALVLVGSFLLSTYAFIFFFKNLHNGGGWVRITLSAILFVVGLAILWFMRNASVYGNLAQKQDADKPADG